MPSTSAVDVEVGTDDDDEDVIGTVVDANVDAILEAVPQLVESPIVVVDASN